MLRALTLVCMLLAAPAASPYAWANGNISPADLHCLAGCPVGAEKSSVMVLREIYALSANRNTKFADWVAYRVMPETIGPTARRNWKPDPALDPETTLEPPDFKGAYKALGTDRGHLVPLASFTGTPHWPTTNYLSNIVPQKSALNRGPWLRIENAVRKLARQPHVPVVYVMAGPLYERPMPALPGADEPHQIPSGYWKIVAIESTEGVSAAAFVFDQETARKARHCNRKFATTVDAIEARTGLDFYWALPADRENAIESGLGTLRGALGCG